MLTRTVVGSILCAAAIFVAGACNDDGPRGEYYAPNGAYGNSNGYGYDPCNQFASCGGCTLAGCGWCSTGTAGACLSDPDECNANTFDWTWVSTGCPASAPARTSDAGAKPPPDAGKD